MDEAGHTLLWLLAGKAGIRPYKRFAEEYERAADALRDQGYDVTPAPQSRQYQRWLVVGGVKTEPYAATARVLTRMFGRPVHELMGPADAVPQQDQQLATTVPVLDERDLEMTARDAAAHAGDAASLALPEMSLDQIDDDVRRLARDFFADPPAVIYRRADELLRTAQTWLDRTNLPRQKQRLYLAAGQAAALLSAVSFDVGVLTPAVTLARTSAMYGSVIEHGPLQAYAHGALAFLAYWDGRPTEAVRLAKQAQQFGGLGDTALRRLLVIEARAHGHLGNAEQAQHAIRTSLELDTGARDELHDDTAGEFAFPTARIAMSNATTYLLLRDAEGAETSASQALELLDGQPSERQPVLVAGPAAIDLARARLVRGELDGAQEALAPVFQVPAEWRGAGMLERLVAARAELTRPSLRDAPAAQALGEQIEEFAALSPVRRIGATGHLAIQG
ncbi:hypothetical protein ACLIYP_00910 [Streptomyces nanhaiensis]|uniref:hypothetical protein n=1 Tax=Streptomyces nanhaiensis TaxID=679319 RepID=UPI00399C7806